MAMANRINWTQIINDILRSDIRIDQQYIARKIGVHRSSITRMRTNGIEPKYYQGNALINLWRDSIKNQSATPPTF